MGVKNKLIKNHGIKIWGQPNLKLNKKYEIKNYLKDHRVMAMSTIAALTLGGEWKIHEPESIKTSFPSFFKILKKDLRVKNKFMKLKKNIKIAIDSPAAAGAGTQAKLISKHYKLLYLDTGKIYRLLGYYKIKNSKKFNSSFIIKKMKNLKMN